MDALSIIERLVADLPERLSELEGVVGPLRRRREDLGEAIGPLRRTSPAPAVTEATVHFEIDLHHQDPRLVKDPILGGWSLVFERGRDATEALLRQRLGEPRPFLCGERRLLGFGGFFLAEGPDGPFELTWYSDWARAEPPLAPADFDPTAREAFLASLRAALSAGASSAEVGGLVRSAPGPAGIRAGPADSRAWSFLFQPPADAAQVCRVLGFAGPFAVAQDVHQTRWQIGVLVSELDGPTGPVVRTRAPGLGGWTVAADLAGRPSGELPRVTAGGAPAFDLLRYAARLRGLTLKR